MMGFFEIFSSALAGIYEVVPSFGLAIIVLTLIVRVLLLPLSIKQSRSMREMQALRPELKRLQTKHKGDRQKLNEEMMKLYKEHGVNPFGGCLPMVAQFPILIALYYVVRSPLQYLDHIGSWSLTEALRDHPLVTNTFIGVRLDCTPGQVFGQAPSATIEGAACGTSFLDFIPYLLLIALMAVTMFYSQKQIQATSTADDAQAQQMQLMGKLMPALFVVFGFSFPTGVLLYWNVTNVWTVVQQRMMLGSLTGGPEDAGNGKAKGKGQAPPAAPPKGKAEPKPGAGGDGKGSDGRRPPKGRAVASGSKPHPSSKKRRKR